ncbi:MAG: hypothetical protein ACOVOR_03865 [Rhabdochlamydiaceae bacterium]
MIKTILFIFSLVFSGCGYQFSNQLETVSSKPTLTILAEKKCDFGDLNRALVREVLTRNQFVYDKHCGQYALVVNLIDDHKHKIGFRYDYDQNKEKLKSRLTPVEWRRILKVEVSLFDQRLRKNVWGPKMIEVDLDYDCYNNQNVNDLGFLKRGNIKESVMDFSMGQLDSKEGAEENTNERICTILASSIFDQIAEIL